MPVSSEELTERLNWTIQQKIDHSLGTIEAALSYSDNNAYVSFSGGKDSVVLLYLCRMVKPDIKAVFFNTTNEFPEIYRFIKDIDCIKIRPAMNLKTIINKIGFPLVSKEQAQYIREARHTKKRKATPAAIKWEERKPGKISNKWQHLINAPFEVSEKCCFYLKKQPAIKFEKESKLLPIIGTLVGESSLRKQKYLKTGCNAFELKRPASYPLSIWTTENIWEFIRMNKIPYCEIYDKGATQTGCMICGFGCQHDDRFKRLQEMQPRAFEIGMSFKNNDVTYKEAINYTLKNEKL